MLEAPLPLWDLVAGTPWLKIMHLVAVRKGVFLATLVLTWVGWGEEERNGPVTQEPTLNLSAAPAAGVGKTLGDASSNSR